MDTHGRAARGSLAVGVGVALLLASLGPGLAEGAKEPSKSKPATLSVEPPKKAKVGAQYKIRASGYSGRFNRLLIVGSTVKCPKNADQAYLTFTAHTQVVKEQHN